MFQKLHKRLTLLYTLSIGTILTFILFVCFFYMKTSMDAQQEAVFTSLFLNISSRFHLENTIQDSWLAQTETANRLIIHIEENNHALLFPGAWTPATKRDHLIEKAMQQAEQERVTPSALPLASSSLESSVMTLTGKKNDVYKAMMVIDATSAGYKSLVVLQDVTDSMQQLFYQGLVFLLLDLAGICGLFVVSWFVVGKTLQPLKENQKKQAEFIAAASHELRSPLAVIQASASAAKTSPKDTELLLGGIEKECVRMGRLLKDLLLLAASDSQRWQISKKPMEGDTLLLEVYETFEPLCKEKQIPLILELPDMDFPKILCDKDRFLQIFTILLDNAMSYTKLGKAIHLGMLLERKNVCFLVMDHGKGIPDADKPYVFERFYQSDKARNAKEHFGLGLAVAKELALLHKGELLLKDTPGGGCTFLLKLPGIWE